MSSRFESSVQSKRLDSKLKESDDSESSKDNDAVHEFNHQTLRNSNVIEFWPNIAPVDANNISYLNLQRKGLNYEQRKLLERMDLNDNIKHKVREEQVNHVKMNFTNSKDNYHEVIVLSVKAAEDEYSNSNLLWKSNVFLDWRETDKRWEIFWS